MSVGIVYSMESCSESMALSLDKLPDDLRVEVGVELKQIWSKIKSQVDYGQLAEIKKQFGRGIYKNVENFNLYLNQKRNPPLLLVRRINKLSNSLKFPIISLKGKRIKSGMGGNAASSILPTELTSKLAYLVGALRDGTLARHGKYEISYSQKNTEWLDLLSKLIVQVFQPSNKPRLVCRENRTAKLIISNRPIFEFFHNLFEAPIGNKINWSTPTLIKKSNSEIKRYYMRGFYDADGLAHKLGFCQVNYEAISDIKKMLELIGIKTTSISKREWKGKVNPIYYLSTRKESYEQFIKLIGSSNASKRILFPPTEQNAVKQFV